MSDCIEYSSIMTAKRKVRKVKGKPPEGLMALHTCDNRLCGNPDHIYFGTRSQNSLDKRNRQQGNKLTWDQVNDLRDDRKKGMTLEQLGWKYHITPTMASLIVRRKAWV